MVMYAQAMYQCWRQGRSDQQSRLDHKQFVRLCSDVFCYSLEETESILRSTTWFLY